MTYTFTEDEIKMFLDWSVYAQGEKSHLDPKEVTNLIMKIKFIVSVKKTNIRLVGIVLHILQETITHIFSLKKKVRNL